MAYNIESQLGEYGAYLGVNHLKQDVLEPFESGDELSEIKYTIYRSFYSKEFKNGQCLIGTYKLMFKIGDDQFKHTERNCYGCTQCLLLKVKGKKRGIASKIRVSLYVHQIVYDDSDIAHHICREIESEE